MLPQQQHTGGVLSQFASLAGTGFDFGNSSLEDLYGRILTSNRILDPVIRRKWAHRDHPDSVTIGEVLGIEAAGDASPFEIREADAGIKTELRSHVIRFYRDEYSGFMLLRVTLPGDPDMAATVANYIVSELEVFNSEYNQEKAEKQQAFLETRSVELDRNLRQAEQALTDFSEANRNYTSSPALMQKYDELEREVQAETSLWIELRRQLELARIEAARDPETVTILDHAQPPVRRSSPNRALFAAVGLAASLVLAVGFVLVRNRRDARWSQPQAESTR